MQIPFLDLTRLEDGFSEQWEKKVRELSEKVLFIGGAQVELLQKNLMQTCQTQAAITCANGTDALQLALRAIGSTAKDKVLLPNFTFWGTFEAVVNVGAQPIVVDISRKDLQMDFSSFQEAVHRYKPKAAILVHLYGACSRHLQDYRKFCQTENVFLIEDGAQCFGTTWMSPTNQNKMESIYRDAQIATISFYPAKVYGAAGDAGAVLTNDEALAKAVLQLGNHGRSDHYSYDYSGWNSRMDSLQAAYLNCVLPFFPARLESRKKTQVHYEKLFDELGLEVPQASPNIVANGYLNTVLVKNKMRDRLTKYLSENGIGYAIVYPETISEQVGAQKYLLAENAKDANEDEQSCAKAIAAEVLSLPQFPYLSTREFDYIQEKLHSFFKGSTR